MTTPSAPRQENAVSSPTLILAAVLLALLGVRILALYFSRINLFFDEAQYWVWSEILDFGYFSKPPILAWSIRAATETCGLTEFCIRLPSPLMHAVTAIFIFANGRALYGPRVGLWAAIVYATLPGVSYSAGLISTDVPLLLFWSAALFFLIKLLETKSWGWAAALGIALGFGLMSKYAMAYFILCTILFAILDKNARWILKSPKTALALGLAALIIAPNIAWNISNGFVTFSHTAENAKWEGALFHPGKAIEFFAAQFGVFGPILFAALLIIVWRFFKQGITDTDRMLLTFSIPIIVIITVQAFLSRAHANWAATAYPAATILVTATMFRDRATNWFRASMVLHICVLAILTLALANARDMGLPKRFDPFKRVLGWEEIASEVRSKAETGGYAAVLTNNRALISELLYYAKDLKVPLTAWRKGRVPHDHFQLTRPFKPKHSSGPVLFVTLKKDPKAVTSAFTQVKFLGSYEAKTGSESKRTIYFYTLSGYTKG